MAGIELKTPFHKRMMHHVRTTNGGLTSSDQHTPVFLLLWKLLHPPGLSLIQHKSDFVVAIQ